MSDPMPVVLLGSTEVQLVAPTIHPLARGQIRQGALFAPLYGAVAALGTMLPKFTGEGAPTILPMAAFQNSVSAYAEHIMGVMLDQGLDQNQVHAAGLVALSYLRSEEVRESEVATATGFFGRMPAPSTEH
jgi:hypothetical protein